MLAAILAMTTAAPDTLSLSRGAVVDGGSYAAVEDTFLLSQEPDTNHGGSTALSGGPGKTILLRFGALDRAVPLGKRVKSAKLVLTIVTGATPGVTSLGRVLMPWGEGPLASFGTQFRPSDPRAKVEAPVGAATWRERKGKSAGWSRAGATGDGDIERVDGIAASATEAELTIAGLENLVQNFADRPTANHGIALQFSAPIEFASSQARSGRPRLELELEDAPVAASGDLAVTEIRNENGQAVATVRNVGTSPSSANAVWVENDRTGSDFSVATIAPGESRTYTTAMPGQGTVELRLKTREGDPRNDAVIHYVSGVTGTAATPQSPAALQGMVRYWNEVVLPHSRFSFAPTGVEKRLNVVYGQGPTISTLADLSALLGLPKWQPIQGAPKDRFAGLLGYGDTRFEGVVPGALPIPYDPIDSPIFAVNPLEPSGLLTMTDVARLNANDKTPFAMPTTVLLRAADLAGRPLPRTTVNFYKSSNGQVDRSKPTFTLTSLPSGAMVFPKEAFAEVNPVQGDYALYAEATANGVSDGTWLYAWMLYDAAARGSRSAATMELRFNVPALPIQHDSELAAGKLVTDSIETPPAALAALVGNGSDIKLGAKAGDWVEIDLGRDRTIGEIKLFAGDAMWNRFDIVGYGTGQRPSDAGPIVKESDWDWTSDRRAKDGAVAYRGGAPRVRFIRIINRSGEAGQIQKIQVFPAVVGGN